MANPVEYESLTDLNLMCRAFEAREDDDPDVYEKVQTVRDDLDAAPRTPLQYANLALNSDEIPYRSYDAPLWPDSKAMYRPQWIPIICCIFARLARWITS